MLRVVAHKSAAAAQSYYTEGLRREDYYAEGQEVAGKWHGKAAGILGLDGGVTPDAFAALVANRHPGTGERLTARTKGERVVGYDLNFHAPKSLSILHALTGDKRILEAFRSAVAETMSEMEGQVATRVRRGGKQENRVTGNFVWAEFVHFTARPVGGIPDPHLHVHCFAFNATFDDAEGRWKAANFRQLKTDAPYSQAAFHARLAVKLGELGYGIERTRSGWEVSGVPRTLIDRFSRRTAQIDRLAESRGITNPKEKDALGAASREGKRKGLTGADLLAAWEARLAPDEKALLSKVARDKGRNGQEKAISVAKAFEEACEKCFAKASVVEVNRVVAETLRFGLGSVTPAAAWKEFERREMIVRESKGEILCTSLNVLAEEVYLINFVRSGRGMCAPLKSQNLRFRNEELSEESRAAVRHILNSKDQVIGVRGVAGAGKTTLMKEAVAQIEATRVEVFAFAPSADASRDTLRKEGFHNAETVAHLLNNKKLQMETRGKVIWIDEAGTVGAEDMLEIMRIAGDSTRVILTGDTAQHAPVARGDAFRLIQHYAGLRVAELTQIRRQETASYREAVAALSKGELRIGFRRLDELGAIVEVADAAERYRLLAQDFLALSRKDSVPLVVSPTHGEGQKVTEAIRDAKREAGKLGVDRAFTRYHNLQWEAPDRRRAENYRNGLVVQFHQNVHGIKRGALFRVEGQDGKGGVLMTDLEGGQTLLPLDHASRFQVFEAREIRLAKGDRLRITRNGTSDDGRRLNNGNIFTVRGFTPEGKIQLNTGAVLSREHGHFNYGYCQTSHSSQSKSVRDVLVAQSSDSVFASSREQFYVSVSRGKKSIRIYTDDRRELQQAVGNSSLRRAGVELAGISGKDIRNMNDGLNGTQWRERIRSRHGGDESKSQVKALLSERRMPGDKKADNVDFRQYIQMRKNLAGPDGKSRSKGTPGFGTKGVRPTQRGGGLYRQTQPQNPPKVAANENKKAKAAPVGQKKQPANPRLNRLAKACEAAKKNFAKVTGRVKDAAKSIRHQRSEKKLPQSNTEQVSKHRSRQRSANTGAAAKTQTKVPQKPVTPPPPTRRR